MIFSCYKNASCGYYTRLPMDTKFWKYRTGKISSTELDNLVEWMEDSSDLELRSVLEQEWNNFASATSLSKEKVEALRPTVCKNTRRNFTNHFTAIAACVLLLICVGLGLHVTSIKNDIETLTANEVVISAGDEGQSTIELPDGSKVKLNARSSVRYNTDFGIDERRVILEGEGFFDVKKNPDTRFVVTAPGMEVAVHGTKFNIYAYPDREFSEMSLLEGSVTLYSGESTIKVAPNEKVCIDRCTGRVNLRKTDNKVETAWLKKTLVFMHEPLYRVVDMLERRFGVHIECSDEISMSDIYTGTFRDRSIYDILEVLKMHYGFTYEADNNRITIKTNNN